MFKKLNNQTQMNKDMTEENNILAGDMNGLAQLPSKVHININNIKGEIANSALEISYSNSMGDSQSKAFRSANNVLTMPMINPLSNLGNVGLDIPSMIPSRISKKNIGNNDSKMDSEIKVNDSDSDFDFVIPSKVLNTKVGLVPTPNTYNEGTSFLVNTTDANSLLNGISIELNNCDNDTEFTVNKENYIIEGIVYIMNYAVAFAIHMFKENNKQLRIEFNRLNGDCVQYQEFYQNILSKIVCKYNTDFVGEFPDKKFGFGVCLDYNFTLDNDSNMAYTLSETDQNRFVNDLKKNMYTVDTINEIYMACEQSKKNIDIVLDNKELSNVLLNMLKHKDNLVVRQTLMLLNMINEYKQINMDIVYNILPILNNKSKLIRVYAAKALSMIDIKVNKFTKNDIKIRVKNVQKGLSKDSNTFSVKNVNIEEIFSKIYNKLV